MLEVGNETSLSLSALLITGNALGLFQFITPVNESAPGSDPPQPGHTATTTLTGEGNQTNFDFYVTGVPNGTILPPRLYTFINKGSCQQPGPAAFAMNDKVNTEPNAGTGGWTFYRSAPIAMPDLLSGKYSVVVRTSPEDGSADIFCGDIAHATR